MKKAAVLVKTSDYVHHIYPSHLIFLSTYLPGTGYHQIIKFAVSDLFADFTPRGTPQWLSVMVILTYQLRPLQKFLLAAKNILSSMFKRNNKRWDSVWWWQQVCMNSNQVIIYSFSNKQKDYWWWTTGQ